MTQLVRIQVLQNGLTRASSLSVVLSWHGDAGGERDSLGVTERSGRVHDMLKGFTGRHQRCMPE
jgi:hypothetical protein